MHTAVPTQIGQLRCPQLKLQLIGGLTQGTAHFQTIFPQTEPQISTRNPWPGQTQIAGTGERHLPEMAVAQFEIGGNHWRRAQVSGNCRTGIDARRRQIGKSARIEFL